MLRYGPDSPSRSVARAGGGSGARGASPSSSSSKPKGADLILRDLTSGTDLTVGSISEFNSTKRVTVSPDERAEEKLGNGISVYDLKTSNVTPIDSGKAT